MSPVSMLFLAPPALSGCVFAAIYRDTRGAVLPDADRVNHFPASPLVSVTVQRSGQLFLLPAGRDWHDTNGLTRLPRISVMPPTDSPLSSWAQGDIEAVTIGFYPDAWLQLGGAVDFSSIPDSVARAVDAFATLDNPETGWREFCDRLGGIWANQRTPRWQGITNISDWARSLMVRAALSGRGRSLRSFERRLKRFSGQNKRALDFYAAFENLHRVSRRNPDSSLAEIALEAGYSDQSHMGRAVHRATGFSPAYLNRAVETDEPFWCYRLLGERF